MALLDDNTKNQVSEMLAALTGPVEMVLLTGSGLSIPGRDAAGDERTTQDLLEEVAALSDMISLTVQPLASFEDARELDITLTPTTILREAGGSRTNIRFSGLPSGYEFQTLLETLIMLGTGSSGLGETATALVAEIDSPVTMSTFVTPTCPHCPRAVLAGFRFAFHNERITAIGIEANEFPLLSQSHRIQGVPDTLIDGVSAERVLGGQPDRVFVEAVRRAAGLAAAS